MLRAIHKAPSGYPADKRCKISLIDTIALPIALREIFKKSFAHLHLSLLILLSSLTSTSSTIWSISSNRHLSIHSLHNVNNNYTNFPSKACFNILCLKLSAFCNDSLTVCSILSQTDNLLSTSQTIFLCSSLEM